MPTLAAGSTTLRVDRARGGRLASLVVDGHEVLVQPERGQPPDPLLWGCYPMAPFAGRTRGGRFRWGGKVHELAANHAGHAMHGTVFDERWLIEQCDQTYIRLRRRLDPRWPFAGWAVQEMALSPRRLELRLEVHSADLPFPATAGWHPWFRRRLEVGGSLVVGLDAAALVSARPGRASHRHDRATARGASVGRLLHGGGLAGDPDVAGCAGDHDDVHVQPRRPLRPPASRHLRRAAVRPAGCPQPGQGSHRAPPRSAGDRSRPRMEGRLIKAGRGWPPHRRWLG